MLFDLRGRGRRRTVQVIYAGLAVLIGAGLVFFGVGAGFGGGGILSNLTGKEGSGGTTYSTEIDKYKKLTAKQPTNAYAWEKLVLAQLHQAGNGEEYVTRTGGLTGKGRELYSQIAQNWNSYIALSPHNPNAVAAQQMVTVFGEEGLNQPAEAVKALQIVIPAKHESTPQYLSSLYASLASYAYKAKNPNTGDLAAAKAIALASPETRKRLKSELAEVKKHPEGPEYVTKGANGQPIKVKPGPNGTFTGTTKAPSTPQPGGLPTK
jgi:hypothetical protein